MRTLILEDKMFIASKGRGGGVGGRLIDFVY